MDDRESKAGSGLTAVSTLTDVFYADRRLTSNEAYCCTVTPTNSSVGVASRRRERERSRVTTSLTPVAADISHVVSTQQEAWFGPGCTLPACGNKRAGA